MDGRRVAEDVDGKRVAEDGRKFTEDVDGRRVAEDKDGRSGTEVVDDRSVAEDVGGRSHRGRGQEGHCGLSQWQISQRRFKRVHGMIDVTRCIRQFSLNAVWMVRLQPENVLLIFI